ncbi:MAG: aspartate aminotransferase family protein, partial [Anaerolineae bacterium]
EPLDPVVAGTIRGRLLERGLSTNVMRNLLFVGPPLIITESELAIGLDIIDDLLDSVDQEIA